MFKHKYLHFKIYMFSHLVQVLEILPYLPEEYRMWVAIFSKNFIRQFSDSLNYGFSFLTKEEQQ